MAMKVRLIERGATAAQTRDIPITQTEFLIGRAADCDLRLRVSAISRHHCIIRVGPEEVTLVDLGSSNGTFLNGQRVRSQAGLKSGDELQVGECRFLVDLGDRGQVEVEAADSADPLAATIKLRDLVKERRKTDA
jgi:pSer/pThr/pTyr-binding forkhead associated (FHA) protein